MDTLLRCLRLCGLQIDASSSRHRTRLAAEVHEEPSSRSTSRWGNSLWGYRHAVVKREQVAAAITHLSSPLSPASFDTNGNEYACQNNASWNGGKQCDPRHKQRAGVGKDQHDREIPER